MSRELSDPLTEKDKAYMRNRNMPIPGEDSAGVAQSIQPVPGTQGAHNPEDDGNDESDDYNDWTVKKLSKELGERGLPKSGTKDELVSRLEEDDEEE